MSKSSNTPVLNCYVQTEDGSIFIQMKNNNNQWGFSLYTEDWSSPGGLDIRGAWEPIEASDVHPRERQRLEWIFEEEDLKPWGFSPIAEVDEHIVFDDEDNMLVNCTTEDLRWAECWEGGEKHGSLAEEGTEHFTPEGLFVVECGEWKEIETFYVSKHAAYYEDGGKPVLYLFTNEETRKGQLGEVYEGRLRVSENGWEWGDFED